MKEVLISIQPKWVEKIARGEKTIEVRKTMPKLERPFKCYIYETKGEYKTGTGIFAYGIELKGTKKGKGKVIGEFVCDYITGFKAMSEVQALYNETKETCLSHDEIIKYANGKKLYYWHIFDLKIYDKPKDLSEFYAKCNIPESKCKLCDNCYDREDYYGRPYAVKKLKRPPQSWCYVEN